MEMYPEALNLLSHIQKSADREDVSAFHNQIFQNTVFNYALSGQYEFCLNLMNEKQHFFKADQPINNFAYAPYCLYFLGRTEEALKVVRQLKKYLLEENDLPLLDMVQAMIRNNEKKLLSAFTKLQKLSIKNYQWSCFYAPLTMLDEFYTRNYCPENLAEIRKVRLELHAHHFPENIQLKLISCKS